jgi:hypothetical protein
LKDATETPVFILKSLRTTESMITNKERSSIIFNVDGSLNTSISGLGTSDSKFAGALPHGTSHTQSIDELGKNPDETLGTAVAIYEYKAEREDELDVNIGDMFAVKDKATGWWVVEKNGKVGWVPAGCLVENDDDLGNDLAEGPIRGTALFDYSLRDNRDGFRHVMCQLLKAPGTFQTKVICVGLFVFAVGY